MLKSVAPALGLALLVGAGAVVPAYAAVSDRFEAPPSVLAFDQKLKDDAITVDYVRMPEKGYVAVYRLDQNGKPSGEPIGHTPMERGDHRQVQIKLTEAANPGDQLWVTLYKDANDSPTFEPGSGDQPLWSKNELPPKGRIVIQ